MFRDARRSNSSAAGARLFPLPGTIRSSSQGRMSTSWQTGRKDHAFTSSAGVSSLGASPSVVRHGGRDVLDLNVGPPLNASRSTRTPAKRISGERKHNTQLPPLMHGSVSCAAQVHLDLAPCLCALSLYAQVLYICFAVKSFSCSAMAFSLFPGAAAALSIVAELAVSSLIEDT